MAVHSTSILPEDWRSTLTSVLRENSQVVLSGKTTEEVCRPILKLAVNEFGFSLVHVWSVDPRRERLVLIAQEGRVSIASQALTMVTDVATSLTGEAVESKQPRLFTDLTERRGGREFKSPGLLKVLPLRCLYSMPVRNIGNPHQILLVLDFFTEWAIPARVIRDKLKAEFQSYAGLLAAGVESNLRERAFRMTTRASQRLSRIPHLTEHLACQEFARSVQDAIQADWVTVYLEDWTHQQIVRQADILKVPTLSGTSETSVPAKVTEVWRTNREFLAPSVSDESDKHSFFGTLPEPCPQSVMLVPLHDIQGKSRGVVRCVNVRPSKGALWRRSHSYDDVAIVEAMRQAFAPLLDMLLEYQQRDVSLQTLAHELRVPVVALRAVLERMEREYTDSVFRFQYPHFHEARTYVEIMQRHLKELELVRVGPDEIPIVRQSTRLLTEVIIPAKRFIEPLLKQRGFNRTQLHDSGFQDLPSVDIDRGLITQVMFNLLENAIKYFPRRRPSVEFACSIDASRVDSSIEISVRDNGRGVTDDDAERLFSFGFRGTDAPGSNVEGTGLGLWLSRAIARRHEGNLELRNRRAPTEFVLTLPGPRQRWPFYVS